MAVYQVDWKKLRSIVNQSVAINSQPTEATFPELPTVLLWMRFVLGAAYGTYVGLQGARGGSLALQALNLIAFLPFMYCRLYLGTPETGDGAFGMGTTVLSGTAPGLALALLLWIYFYTAQMEEQELKLMDLLLPPLVEIFGGDTFATGDSSTVDPGMVEATLSDPVVASQDEF